MYQGVLFNQMGIEPIYFSWKENVITIRLSVVKVAENAFCIKPRTLAAKHPFPLSLET